MPICFQLKVKTFRSNDCCTISTHGVNIAINKPFTMSLQFKERKLEFFMVVCFYCNKSFINRIHTLMSATSFGDKTTSPGNTVLCSHEKLTTPSQTDLPTLK